MVESQPLEPKPITEPSESDKRFGTAEEPLLGPDGPITNQEELHAAIQAAATSKDSPEARAHRAALAAQEDAWRKQTGQQ